MSSWKRRIAQIPIVGAAMSTVIDLCHISRIRESLHRDDLNIHADVAALQRNVANIRADLESKVSGVAQSLTQFQFASLPPTVDPLPPGFVDELSRIRDNQGHILEQISRLNSENDNLRRSVSGVDAEVFRNLAASFPNALREMRRREIEWQRNLEAAESGLNVQVAAVKAAVEELREAVSRENTTGLGESLKSLSASVAALDGRTEALAAQVTLATQQVIHSQVLAERFRATADDVSRLQRDLPNGFERLGQRLWNVESRINGLAERLPGSLLDDRSDRMSRGRELDRFNEPLRYTSTGSDSAASPNHRDCSPTATIVNPPKISSQQQELRLNLNPGGRILPDYVNVSDRTSRGADVISPFDRLPFEANTVVELASVNVLQQFTEDEIQDLVLPHWFRLLRPNGILKLTVPDTENTIREYTAGQLTFEQLRQSILGLGSGHRSMLSPGLLRRLLKGAGFVNPVFVATGRRADPFLELEVHATRPAQDNAAA